MTDPSRWTASHHAQEAQQPWRRAFSTKDASAVVEATPVDADVGVPGEVSMDGNLLTDQAGQQYGMFLDTRKMPKLKPYIVKRRINRLKTYIGTEKEIRQSPWKLNRVCQLAAGLTLEEALTQLRFCDIKNADLVAKILKRTSNLADIRDGLQMSQLEVAECFTTKGMMLKRIKIMGRGRNGIMHHKYSHVRVMLREIDFKLKIYQAKTLNQKKKWLQHQIRAEVDAKQAKAKRDEMERLLKKQEEKQQQRQAEANK